MCEATAEASKTASGKYDIQTTCKISGKPITIANDYGMFCEDMCNYDEIKKFGDYIQRKVLGMGNQIGDITSEEDSEEFLYRLLTGLAPKNDDDDDDENGTV
jgi:hypothetical protein